VSSPVAIIIADVHATANGGAWVNRPIVGDTAWALKQVASYVRKYSSIEKIIALGDLLDDPLNRSAALHVWADFINLLPARTVIEYIQGNHDKEAKPWLDVFAPRTIHIHRIQSTMTEGKFRYYAFDYVDSEQLEEEIKAIPNGCRFLLTHQTWSEFTNFEDSHQGSASRITNVETVFSGDFHNHDMRDVVNLKNKTTELVSVGSLTMQSIQENPIKNCVVIHSDGGWTKLLIHTRKVLKSDLLNDENELEAFANACKNQVSREDFNVPKTPEECKKPLIHVQYRNQFTDAKYLAKELLSNVGHLFFSVRDEPEKELAERRRMLELFVRGTTKSIKPGDCVGLVLDVNRFPTSANLVNILLSSAEPERDFAEWLKRQSKLSKRKKK